MNVPAFLVACAAMAAIVSLTLAVEQRMQGRNLTALAMSICCVLSIIGLLTVLRWWKAIEPATFAAQLSLLGAS